MTITVQSQDNEESALRNQNLINNQTVLPTNPESAKLAEYGNVNVSHYTGTANQSIDIYTINGNRINLGVNINYATGGVKVEDRGSNSTGVGWALNAGGNITRSVKGAPDMHYNYYDNAAVLQTYFNEQQSANWNIYDFYYKVVHGEYETQPDSYNYSFNGRTGKFHIGADKRVIQKEDSDLDIKPTFKVKQTRWRNDELLTSFNITDESGTIYTFGNAEETEFQFNDNVANLQGQKYFEHSYNSTWHLSKVESYDKTETIQLSYIDKGEYALPINVENYKSRSYILDVGSNNCNISNNTLGTMQEASPNVTRVLNRRFIRNITYISGQKFVEKLIFDYSDNSCQYAITGSDQQLDHVWIYKGDNASNHLLTHKFEYSCLSGRLFLMTTGRQGAGVNSFIDQPPYRFQYHGSSLPDPLSNAQDKWGFYNGQTGNTSLIPKANISGITWTSGAIRTSTSDAVAKSLTRITYPTGGYTNFGYERNSISKSKSNFTYSTCTGCPTLESCQSSLSNCNAGSCVEPTYQAEFVTFGSTFITNGYYIITSDSVCGGGILERTNNNEISRQGVSGWQGTVSFSIFSGATQIGNYTKTHSNPNFRDTIKLSNYFNLQAGESYLAIMQGINTRAEAVGRIGGSALNYTTEYIGGVRLQSVKHYDQNNTFLKGKLYKYTDQGGSRSSGIIVTNPSFHKLGSYQHHFVNQLGGNSCDGYTYTTVVSSSTPSYPMGSFDGSFYGYSRVEEVDITSNIITITNTENQTEGKTVYEYHNTSKKGNIVDVASNGKVKNISYYNDQGKIVKSESYQYAFDIDEDSREDPFYGFKVASHPDQSNQIHLARLSNFSYVWTEEPSVPNEIDRKTYKSKWERSSNDYLKLVNYSTFLTGKTTSIFYYSEGGSLQGQLSNSEQYEYNNPDLVQPTDILTTNSDGDKYVQKFYYPDSYTRDMRIGNYMKVKNLILPAWKTEWYHNDKHIAGDRTIWSYYKANGARTAYAQSLSYPDSIFYYERTWDQNGILGIGEWDLQTSTPWYQGNGKVAAVKQTHWDGLHIYTYDAYGKLLKYRWGTYAQNWQYFPSNHLLSKSIAIDGTSSSFNYDRLLRLSFANDDNRGVSQSYTYKYGTTNNSTKTTTTYPSLGNERKVLVDIAFRDGLNRPYQTKKIAQGPTDANSVVISQTYDKIGRLQYSYEPRSGNNTESSEAISTSHDRSQQIYEASPLHRVTREISPETWLATDISYSMNSTNEVSGYAGGQLHKVTRKDGNDNIVETFRDKRGRQILSRAFDNGVAHDTRHYYDGRDRPIKVVPPGSTEANNDLNFKYAYHKTGLLASKYVPGKGLTEYRYNPRGLEIYKRDPKQLSNNRWLAASYDQYGNVNQQGWFNSVSTIVDDSHENGSINDLRIDLDYGTAGIKTGKLDVARVDEDLFNITYTKHFSYDQAGRQSLIEFNHPLSGESKSLKEQFVYDDADNLIRKTCDYIGVNESPLKYSITKTIDHAGRIKAEYYGQGENAHKKLAEYQYTAKDQVSQLLIGGDIETINYSYLKNRATHRQIGQNFRLDLNYNSGNYGSIPRYNGDITNWWWQIDGQTNVFNFNYDDLNRLKVSKHQTSDKYRSSYGYDMRGNLSKLTRRDFNGNEIDSLKYEYVLTNENRLNYIDDRASNKSQGYDGANRRYYQYDPNGNITLDQSRSTTSTYNHLNLPRDIKKDNSNLARYNYDFEGNLLEIRTTTTGQLSLKRFLGDVEYDGNSISRINHNHGYIKIQDIGNNDADLIGFRNTDKDEYHRNITSNQNIHGSPDVNYFAEETITLNDGFIANSTVDFLADHKDYGREDYFWTIKDYQETVRVIMDDNGNVEKALNYYPFGLRWDYNNDPTYEWNRVGALEQKGIARHLDVLPARVYDRTIGRFTGVDPAADLMPAWSPYSYTFDNPINFTDPTGAIPYPITIRSFAPFKSFGGGFHGDDRGFSNARSYADGRGPSARVHQLIDFDTDKTTLKTHVWSSKTSHRFVPGSLTDTPSVNIGEFSMSSGDGSRTFNFDTHSHGANPMAPGSPNIDVFSDFSITESDGLLSISGSLKGDNFPSTEAFISDPSGQNVFIGVGFYEGSPFSSLGGENQRDISSFSFGITTNSRGNFTEINYNGTNYSVSDWNKLFQEADPHKNADK